MAKSLALSGFIFLLWMVGLAIFVLNCGLFINKFLFRLSYWNNDKKMA